MAASIENNNKYYLVVELNKVGAPRAYVQSETTTVSREKIIDLIKQMCNGMRIHLRFLTAKKLTPISDPMGREVDGYWALGVDGDLTLPPYPVYSLSQDGFVDVRFNGDYAEVKTDRYSLFIYSSNYGIVRTARQISLPLKKARSNIVLPDGVSEDDALEGIGVFIAAIRDINRVVYEVEESD